MSIKLSYHLKHSKSMPRRIVTLETDDFSLEGNAIFASFTCCWWLSLKIVECIGRRSHALLHLICSLSTFRCPGSYLQCTQPLSQKMTGKKDRSIDLFVFRGHD